RLRPITGVSASGKPPLVLESLVPALDAQHSAERRFPTHVRTLDAPDVTKARVVDATPIGINVRSTVATYSGVLDDLRAAFAATDDARRSALRLSGFPYNTGSLSRSRRR